MEKILFSVWSCNSLDEIVLPVKKCALGQTFLHSLYIVLFHQVIVPVLLGIKKSYQPAEKINIVLFHQFIVPVLLGIKKSYQPAEKINTCVSQINLENR
jgi:hypothetical protein